MKTILLGTRGSRLAIWQANHVRNLLLQHIESSRVEIEVIKTQGDRIQNRPLPQIGGKGLFTKEIEDALLEGSIHIAVHSLKDLPTSLPEGLVYAGSPARGDPRDAFVSTRWPCLESVPTGGRVATGSMRRRALILSQYHTITCHDLRGNIHTRLRKLKKEGWDGIIVAAAALERLKLTDWITEYLDPEIFVPSAGQGAIGLEVSVSEHDIVELVSSISYRETVQSVTAERAFMRYLEGGCSIPIGAWARQVDGQLHLTGFFATPDGETFLRQTTSGSQDEPEAVGVRLAQQFIDEGVRESVSQ